MSHPPRLVRFTAVMIALFEGSTAVGQTVIHADDDVPSLSNDSPTLATVCADHQDVFTKASSDQAVRAGRDDSGCTAPSSEPAHLEVQDDPPAPPSVLRRRTIEPAGTWSRGRFTSVQVNVDEFGNNIVGDAANEPSIAIDPTDPTKIVIGWRQFDTVESNFRQAGHAYSHDAGATWTFPGVLEPGVFRSDPVLAADGNGNIFYYSLSTQDYYHCEMFKSTDGGVSWIGPISAYGGDKAWMAIDRTDGIGEGNIYCAWDYAGCCGINWFTRSTDGGMTYLQPIAIPSQPYWGTVAIGTGGEVYVSGRTGSASTFVVARSTNAQDPKSVPVFDLAVEVNLGGSLAYAYHGPNPGGLVGQVWVATDHSRSGTRGNVYVLCSVNPPDADPLDVMFVRSMDGGRTWSEPLRVNDDPTDNEAWQWFGTMSVAPNGRIDVIFNDTRNTGANNLSELFFTFSNDGGHTWAANVPVSPVFDSHVGWPDQNKIGDYYDMISDNFAANVAYSATFNGEQDVYFLQIEVDCNENGTSDAEDIAGGSSQDCDGNGTPDECQLDCNSTGLPDVCDIASGKSMDCDENYNPDECDPDFDGDGIVDGCDDDIDEDGVPNETDVCDFTRPNAPVNEDGSPFGDFDRDCDVDLEDLGYFVGCVARSGPALPAYLYPCAETADYNDDGHNDLVDFARFMEAFTGLR